MSHINSYPFVLLPVLREVSLDRLQKAVNALADGSMTVTPTRETTDEIRARVRNGEGREYGITLTRTGAFCSCPDALYRGVTCKHSATVALFVLRQPLEGAKEEPQQASTPAKPQARVIHITRGPTPSAPRLCGARADSTPAWVIPFVPETPWTGVTCMDCWALDKRPASATAAAA